MLRTLTPVLRETVLVLIENIDRYIPHEGLAELSVFHACISLQGIGGTAAFVNPHVELAASQCTLHAAEENCYLVGLHLRRSRYQFVTVILCVKIEQMVLLGIDLAALVQFAARDSYIVVLRGHRHRDKLSVRKMDTIHGTQGFHE